MRKFLFLGPSGSLKMKAAREEAASLPFPEGQTLFEASLIHGAYGGWRNGIESVPYRAPHHSVSEMGLVGWGFKKPVPGEVSLAHGGCLVLDEICEFRRATLVVLADVLNKGVSEIYGQSTCVFPARPQLLILISTHCPCGLTGYKGYECKCTPGQFSDWNRRLIDYCEILGVNQIVRFSTPARGT